MKCSHCNTINPDPAEYCIKCGKQLKKKGIDIYEIPSESEITHITPSENTDGKFIINNRFKIIKQLGKGGMGEIFLAEDIKLRRKVAIKSISKENLKDAEAKSRFLREAQTASQLEHPNICTIYEISEEEKTDYIVMQYVDGASLDQLMRWEKLSINKITDIAIQISEGMIEAHSQGVIHRDIKPANIMVDKKGMVKILDFGLAKFSDTSLFKENGGVVSNLTEKGIILGTVAYMSPEQARGIPLDQRTDIFSFGAMLFELLEGKNPFQGKENIDTLYNLLNKKIEFTSPVPDQLAEIIYRSIEKEREHRYPDFKKIRSDLEAFKIAYNQKRKKVLEKNTEIINHQEQRALLEEIDKFKRTSDNEDLGDIVQRIKKLKASTQKFQLSKKISWRIGILFVAIALVGLLALNLLKETPQKLPLISGDDMATILLKKFENQTQDKNLSDEIQYLITESLNQFAEFKIIPEAIAREITGVGKEDPVNIESMREMYNTQFMIKGKISSIRDKVNIEAVFSPFDEKTQPPPFTIPGKEKDSILISQIDSLSKRVFFKIFPDKEEKDLQVKKIYHTFGKNWQAFNNFFQGLTNWKKKRFSEAEKYFQKCRSMSEDILIANYLLAEIYNYTGRRREASNLINGLIAEINDFSEPLKMKILSLKANLEFNFPEEIKYLEELKKQFKFSKEIYYKIGEAYFHHGEAEKAVKEYEKALILDPNYSDALNHMGYCQSYLGNHRDAIELLEKYKSIDQTGNAFDSLGDGHFYAGQYDEAENSKVYAISRDPGIYWAYLTLADIHILKANFNRANDALKKYEKIVAKQRSLREIASAKAKKAFILYTQGSHKQALKKIQEALQYDSDEIKKDSHELHWIKGIVYLALNQVDACKEEQKWLTSFKDKYNLSKDNFYTALKFYLHLHALINEKENKIQEADATFKELIQMQSQLSYWITYYNSSYFMTEYAKFLMRNKKYEKASEIIEKCLDYNPNYPPVLWVQAELYKQNNDLGYRSIYKKISEIYGPSEEDNPLRKNLAEELKTPKN